MPNKMIKDIQIPEEFKSSPLSYLEKRVERLSFICDRLNPYEPIPEYLKKELRALGMGEILEGSYDPFSLTNKLIILTENAIEELALYKNA